MEGEFMSDARVDGKYTPTIRELPEVLSKFDLKKEFENTEVAVSQLPGLTLSFDSLEKSHLFALAIYKKGADEELWGMGPSDNFFDATPLTDHRFDSILTFDETLADGKSQARFYTRFNEINDPVRKDRYSKLIRDVVSETMPHLSEEVENFSF